jgi:putative hemolysin
MRWMVKPLDRLLALDQISNNYRQACQLSDARPFADRYLDVRNIAYNISEADLARIPEEGPVIIVANHAFGGIEGVLLSSLLCSRRPDVKFMANYLLRHVHEMRDMFIYVDPFDSGSKSAAANIKPLKESIRWLRAGGMLVTFPSGEVAHYNLRKRQITESQWSDTIARIVKHVKCPVLPMYFEGTNRPYFHAAGVIHPRLRTALLPRQVLHAEGRTFPIYVGNLIPYKKLEKIDDERQIMDFLRMRTYNLRNRKQDKGRLMLRLPLPFRKTPQTQEPLIDAVPPDELEQELNALPAFQQLINKEDAQVWYARSQQIPGILREIGRLRELTFRGVNEGTGKSIDLDEYDEYYIHLFVWNPVKREITSAYRLGPTDEILTQRGKRGLYTFSLFKYRKALLERITPALEMGRSFVRPEYQRDFTSLYLLWKGIALFILQNPKYKILFGPVSINDNYCTSSRNLMVAFLKMNNYLPDLAKMVKARTPFRGTRRKQIQAHQLHKVVDSIDEVEALISDIESELKGIPILLKQYLKLGGKLLGFNIDPDFGYVLDGLILVDVTETERKVLRRYMGADGARKFLAYHGLEE